ncbi:MAG: sigma 54-interacting transcriptional regulator [Gammaproteobacteria bacterium]|nr:sigma 54-interacting transcriptional regulator [Gammaproteobacteria bacterium]MDH5736475.1 sigma 54-interacting transcriptional regulator [Gammaproteobacteria bacterium]
MTSHDFDFAPLLENIVSFLDEGIMVTDTQGNVLYHNPAVCKLLGLDTDKPIRKLHDIGKFNLQRALLRAAIDAGEVDAAGKPSDNFISFEQQFKHDGCNRMVEIISRLITSQDNQKKSRLLLLRDRTDTRHMEAVLNPMGRQLTTQDPRMLEIIDRIYQIAPSNAFILLQGESGTGKTQLGRMIHTQSSRAKQAFVEVNCAAIPESLIESELFGHVKGAFTGASSDRLGRFQSANMGTLFLDEVGEIPLHLQAKLLKAIQDQEFEMVGSDKPVRVDVRIIAASNKNLREMVDKGKFRADLFYRLAVIPLTIPSLRERPGDISLLSKYFCSRLVARGYPDNIICSSEATRMMMDYPWPGNVRELENAIEHGLICAIDGEVKSESLPQDIREYCHHAVKQNSLTEDDERKHAGEIESVLKLVDGNKAEAARMLGVNRTTLWRWIQKYGIEI